MAQTKRKRRSKHRGTAAGTIQTRGRTGRPPTAEEKKKESRDRAREQRLNKLPTWSASIKRAALASVLMFAFVLLTTKGKDRLVGAEGLAVLAMAIYVPAGYYIELFLYRRRQRRKASS